VDSRADLYALGIVAYEMLVGAPPFQADTPVAVLLKHVRDPIPIPSADRLPPPMLGPLLKALAKERDDRWPSALAFVDALERGLGAAPPTLPMEAPDDPTPRAAAADLHPAPTVVSPRTARDGEPRAPFRGGSVAAVGLAAALVVGGALGVRALRSAGTTAPSARPAPSAAAPAVEDHRPSAPEPALSAAQREAIAALRATSDSWVGFHDLTPPDHYVMFTHLVSWRCGLREVRYKIDGRTPDQLFPLPPCDPKRPNHLPRGDDSGSYVRLKAPAKFVAVKLVYADGTESETSVIENLGP
jgi:hypothetical protein